MNPNQLLARKLIKWLQISHYETKLHLSITSIEVDLCCEYTLKRVEHPARTTECKGNCIVQKNVLLQMGVCSCGAEIDFENTIIDDNQLEQIVQIVGHLFGDNVKKILLDVKGQLVLPQ